LLLGFSAFGGFDHGRSVLGLGSAGAGEGGGEGGVEVAGKLGVCGGLGQAFKIELGFVGGGRSGGAEQIHRVRVALAGGIG
jgi:hypothetical protein